MCITWLLIVFCVVAYVQGHWYASVYVYVCIVPFARRHILCAADTLVDGCLCTYLLILLYCSLFFTVFTFWHWQVADDVGGPLSLVSDLYS